jgi:hypothetical protein
MIAGSAIYASFAGIAAGLAGEDSIGSRLIVAAGFGTFRWSYAPTIQLRRITSQMIVSTVTAVEGVVFEDS